MSVLHLILLFLLQNKLKTLYLQSRNERDFVLRKTDR